MDLYDKLKKYFDETPKEQVLKDWEETEIYDNVNSPTIEQLYCDHQFINAGALQGQVMKRCLKCGYYTQAN